MEIHNSVAKAGLLASCAGVVFALGAGAAQAATTTCAPVIATKSVIQAQPGRVTLLERDAGYAPAQLVFNPTDAADLLVVEDDGTVHRLEITGVRSVGREAIPSDIPVSTAAFSPDGKRIAVGRADGTTFLVDSRRPAKSRILRGPRGRVIALAFSPDGHRLAAEGLDGRVYLWSGRNLARKIAFQGAPLADVIRFSRDNSEIGVGTYEGLFVFSNLGGGDASLAPKRYGLHRRVLDLAFATNGHGVQTASAHGRVDQWPKALTGRGRCGSERASPITAMSFSRDGSRIAAGYLDGAVLEWQPEGATTTLRVLRAVRSPIRSLAFSPTGDALAVASLDGTVRLWRLTGG